MIRIFSCIFARGYRRLAEYQTFECKIANKIRPRPVDRVRQSGWQYRS